METCGVEKMPEMFFPEHHESHAASAFFPSPFESAAILTLDGVGEWATSAIGHGQGSELKILQDLHFPPFSRAAVFSLYLFYRVSREFRRI